MISLVTLVAAIAVAASNAQGVNGSELSLRANALQQSICPIITEKSNLKTKEGIPSIGTFVLGLVTDTIIPELASDAVDLLFNALFTNDDSGQVAAELDKISSGIRALKGEVKELQVLMKKEEFESRFNNLHHLSLDKIRMAGDNLKDFIELGVQFDVSSSHDCLNDYLGQAQISLVDNAKNDSPLNYFVGYASDAAYPATGLRGVRQDIVNLVNHFSGSVGQALVLQSVLEAKFPRKDSEWPHRHTMIQRVKDIIYQMWFYIGASYPTLDGQGNHFYFKNKVSSKNISKYALIDSTRANWNVPGEKVERKWGQDVHRLLDWTFFEEPQSGIAYSDKSVQAYLQSEGLATTNLYIENLEFNAYPCYVGRRGPGMRQYITHEALYLDFTNGKIGKDELIDYVCCDIQDKNQCSLPLPEDVWDKSEQKYSVDGGNYLRVVDMTNFYSRNTSLPALLDHESIGEERDGIIINSRRDEIANGEKLIKLLVKPGSLTDKSDDAYWRPYWIRVLLEDGKFGALDSHLSFNHHRFPKPEGDPSSTYFTLQKGHHISAVTNGFIVKSSTLINSVASESTEYSSIRFVVIEGECLDDGDCDQGKHCERREVDYFNPEVKYSWCMRNQEPMSLEE